MVYFALPLCWVALLWRKRRLLDPPAAPRAEIAELRKDPKSGLLHYSFLFDPWVDRDIAAAEATVAVAKAP